MLNLGLMVMVVTRRVEFRARVIVMVTAGFRSLKQ